jgi:hypothetical protein
MTQEELEAYARGALELAVEQLHKHGCPLNCFHLISEKETQLVVVPSGEMNDPRFKDELAWLVACRVASAPGP